jgi:AcrR family transcriptional regulator
MANDVTTNKQGQKLGRKGHETRLKLVEAARRLLGRLSPVDLTAVAIAKEANISSASFYMYFDDVPDVLYALSQVAGEEMLRVREIVDEPWEPHNVEQQAKRMVETLNDIWRNHREVLRFRNLEADRGNPRFQEIRMSTYIPFIEHFAQRIISVNPATMRKRSDVYAEATVLHAAMERMAATDPSVMERGLGAKRINKAMARIIARTLLSEEESEIELPISPAKPKSRARSRKAEAVKKANVSMVDEAAAE